MGNPAGCHDDYIQKLDSGGFILGFLDFGRTVNCMRITARQNGFIYKVKTQAKEYQKLKVDTLSIQNSRKLKSYTVEFFSDKFLSAPTEIRTHDPQI